MHRFYLIIYVLAVMTVGVSLTACQKEEGFTLTDEKSDGEGSLLADEESDAEAQDQAFRQTEATELYVFVCGQVANPGVYCLPDGSRICDAVDMAGGCLESADIDVVNQAERLTDGAKVYIPAMGEELDSDMTGISGIGTASEGSDLSAGTSSAANAGKLNLNTATREELLTLPGIGETKADAILEYRDSHGSFTSIEEIMNIAGIKEGVFSNIEEYITVE